jgi:formylglycine-generating enzyme required for sulfatase activity
MVAHRHSAAESRLLAFGIAFVAWIGLSPMLLSGEELHQTAGVPSDTSSSACGNATEDASSAEAKPLSRAQECGLKPKDLFKECAQCPEMIVVPAGAFTMGSPDDEPERNKNEGPQRQVTFARPFAVGRYAVTFDEWDACVAAGGCDGYLPSDQGWGRGRRPVIHVSWYDAKAYLAWLSRLTGKTYRLPTEAEREYVARAGTTTPFWFGDRIALDQANFDDKHPYNNGPAGGTRGMTLPVDAFAPNPWGLYQVHGNVWDWVEDCFHAGYAGAPSDGSAWISGECAKRISRGGAWLDQPRFLRSAFRLGDAPTRRYDFQGFRVVRVLGPD